MEVRTEELLSAISEQYTWTMSQYLKAVESDGYSAARAKWDRTIIALEMVVERFDLRLAYDAETNTTTIERY